MPTKSINTVTVNFNFELFYFCYSQNVMSTITYNANFEQSHTFGL